MISASPAVFDSWPESLSALNFYPGVVFCRQHLCMTISMESLLLPRLAPPVALCRERRPVTAQAGGAFSYSRVVQPHPDDGAKIAAVQNRK